MGCKASRLRRRIPKMKLRRRRRSKGRLARSQSLSLRAGPANAFDAVSPSTAVEFKPMAESSPTPFRLPPSESSPSSAMCFWPLVASTPYSPLLDERRAVDEDAVVEDDILESERSFSSEKRSWSRDPAFRRRHRSWPVTGPRRYGSAPEIAFSTRPAQSSPASTISTARSPSTSTISSARSRGLFDGSFVTAFEDTGNTTVLKELMMSGPRECSLPIVDRTMLESSHLTWPDVLKAAYDYGLVDEDDIQRYACGEYGIDELRQLYYDLFSDRGVVGGRRTRWGDLSLRGYYAPSQFPRRPLQYRLRRTQSYPNVNLHYNPQRFGRATFLPFEDECPTRYYSAQSSLTDSHH